MNVNKTILAGRLTRDPEVRFTPKGTAVTEISLAINRRVKGQGDQWTDETAFIDVTVWGKQAENVGKYLNKGSVAFVEGRLQLDSWDDKQTGQKRSKLKVVAENVQFGPQDAEQGGQGGQRRQRSNQTPPPALVTGDGKRHPLDSDVDDPDSELPF